MTTDRRTLLKYGLASLSALQGTTATLRSAPVVAAQLEWRPCESSSAASPSSGSKARSSTRIFRESISTSASTGRCSRPRPRSRASRTKYGSTPWASSRRGPWTSFRTSRSSSGTKLQRKISEYMRDNLYITTSGMAWAPVIQFCQEALGVDHVLYAMDYPCQMDDYEVVATDRVPISFDAKKKLFQTNAERLFKLSAATS